MDALIIASKNKDEAHLINETINKEYDVTLISSPDNFQENKNGIKLIILDQNFTEKYGLDFLSTTLKNANVPIIYLVGPDDLKVALEAMKRGAFNVVLKVSNYNHLLYLLIKKTISEFSEKKKLYQGIKIFKKKVEDLENAVPGNKENGRCESDSEESSEETVFDHIMQVFRRGEIDLPSPPQIGIKFRKLLEKKADLQEIGILLSKDMAISSKLISISNTAYYRGVEENKNLTQAIGRLGIDTTQQYVEAILNRSLYITKKKDFAEYIESLWQHSLSCAYAAQILKEMLSLSLGEDAFTLGLLHDIGKLVLFKIIAELQLKKKLDDTMDHSEILEIVDENHYKFGASVLKMWTFPDEYIRTATYHDDLDAADNITEDLLIINFANKLVKSMGYVQGEAIEIDLSSLDSASSLNLDENTIDSTKDKLKSMMDEIGGFLS